MNTARQRVRQSYIERGVEVESDRKRHTQVIHYTPINTTTSYMLHTSRSLIVIEDRHKHRNMDRLLIHA